MSSDLEVGSKNLHDRLPFATATVLSNFGLFQHYVMFALENLILVEAGTIRLFYGQHIMALMIQA